MKNPSTPLYLCQQIRTIEESAGSKDLMQRAGLAIAELAKGLLPDSEDSILIVAGPGNNGGDALVAARHLKQSWHKVVVVMAGEASKLPADAAKACKDWLAVGGVLENSIPQNSHFGLVIDGLFGIGLQRPLQGHYAELIQQINALPCPVLTVDIPSGLSADTGCVLGCAVEASHTLTFLGLKPGLYTLDGPDHAGEIHYSDLGVDGLTLTKPDGWLLEQEMFTPALPARKKNSHKGLFGNVAVIGGEVGMTGAMLLAARAALLIGGGRVYGGVISEHGSLLDPMQPELMLRRATALHTQITVNCAVIGPGMGRSPAAAQILADWMVQTVALVLDADALQLIATHQELRDMLRQRQHETVITPHPGEAASLLGYTRAKVQSDRITNALKLAQELHVVAILKGAGTVIAEPGGDWFINTTGNPGLSAAGTGDVLAGMIGGLMAQGLSASEAAKLGVYLHGAAADELVAQGIGPVGLTASEVALMSRELINQLV
ncbi:MAG TPA: NAD(P)H-hydrate dehydratase [Methylophilaceae bacterium]